MRLFQVKTYISKAFEVFKKNDNYKKKCGRGHIEF